MLAQVNWNDYNNQNKSKIIDIDSPLITEFQENRDLTAFTKLMNKYKNKVYNFCYRYIGNRDDADDLTQEIFIKVYEKAGSFRGYSKFSTWLYSISSNTCFNFARKLKTRSNKEESIVKQYGEEENFELDIKDKNYDPEHQYLNKELGRIIRIAVSNLKENQRSVLILKDFMGKSYEEISEITGLKLGTLKSTLSRGRLNVINQIKDYRNQ